MNISEDLRRIDQAVTNFRRQDEVDAYQIVQPAETALRRSCERMEQLEAKKAENYYQSDLFPQVKHFVQALNQYMQNQDFQSLRSAMNTIQKELKDFNRSIDYLIRSGLVREAGTVIITQETADIPPLRRKKSPAQKQKETLPPVQRVQPQPLKRKPLPVRKTLEEKYFTSGMEEDETVLNKNLEVIIKITAIEPKNGKQIVQYYLANKNAFRKKETYPNLFDRIARKNKIICYQQAFRVSDWKPLFPDKDVTEEYLSLSKNIFGVPREGNLQDDGLILKLSSESLKITFKTYGERTSKTLTSEFLGQTQPFIELQKKDFLDKSDKYACHYEDMISFYHQFHHVKSKWNEKETLVKLKMDIRLK
ncbi:MAG: hypothetical protein IKP69_11820 [Oscillospiraceae bacterium]|nr:hypothetical protein [Oscillospiraceae bacterium]